MVFYPRDARGGPHQQMYSQRGVPTIPMRRQDEGYFYPNHMRMQGETYPGPMRRQDEAYNYPGQMRGMDEAYNYPGQMRRQDRAPIYPNQMRGQHQPPNQRPQSGFERLPNQLNTIMGHMGTITQGVNMMRQIGSLLSLFRK